MLKRIYYIIFYHIFHLIKFERNTVGKAFASSFLISMVQSFNIASVIYIWKVSNKVSYNFKLAFFVVFSLISIFNLFIFNYKHKFEEIIREIEILNRSGKVNTAISILIVMYLIFSFLILAFSVLMDAVVGDFRIIFQYLEHRFR